MIPVINQLEQSVPPLEYERYLRFQERLRKRRRELLLFCEHPALVTAGVQARPENLLSTEAQLTDEGVSLIRVGRGGDYTAHEPGQCVIYPHLDLKKRSWTVSDFFREMLMITSRCIQEIWQIKLESDTDAPGLYDPSGAKLVSIGIMFKSFFTSHGLAVNVSNPLDTFRHIHPCGYSELAMTSIADHGGDPALMPRFIALWRQSLEERL